MEYSEFLASKRQLAAGGGFEPVWLPDWLFPFQRALCEWAIRRGRAAIFADCGLGKTPMQLVWAENVARHAKGRVLILTPLAVSYQTIREAEKFDIDARRSSDGAYSRHARIVVTNYERLDRFSPDDFVGVVCDESSILKNFSGVRRKQITEFLRTRPYRLLCTATAAPNDYTELGTSSEALGILPYMDVLERFFKNTQNEMARRGGRTRFTAVNDDRKRWRFRGHSEPVFWSWVRSWSRVARKPSDLGGFSDKGWSLPPLIENCHIVEAPVGDGLLFPLPAVGLYEQRQERRRSIRERCKKVAELVDHGEQALVWCHLNAEGDLLEKIIPDAEQVAGRHQDIDKEAKLRAFADGELRVLVTKPKIGAFGLNLQRCSHVTFFPSHSYEQYYQGIRRCWRFGQERPVRVDVVTTEGEADVLLNLQHKAAQADQMFEQLVAQANETDIEVSNPFTHEVEVPAWL